MITGVPVARAAGGEGPGAGSGGLLFSDITASDPNYVFINYLAQNKLVHGYPDGTFGSRRALERSEAVALLVRAAGLAGDDNREVAASFRDLPAGHWAAGAVRRAVEAGLVRGFPDGTFRPEARLTRAEAVALLFQWGGQNPPAAGNAPATDVPAGHWAAAQLASALDNGLLTTDAAGRAFPDLPISRGDFARALAIAHTLMSESRENELVARVVLRRGNVRLERGSDISRLLNPVPVQAGMVVETLAGSSAEIVFEDGSSLLLEENSRLVLRQLQGARAFKTDGTPISTIERLEVELSRGTMFGALASPHMFVATSEGEQEGTSPTGVRSHGDRAAAGPEQAVAPGLDALDGLALLDSGNSGAAPGLEPGQSGAAQSLLAQMLAAQSASPVPKRQVTSSKGAALPWYAVAKNKPVKVIVNMPWGVAAIRGTFWCNEVTDKGQSTSVLRGEVELTAAGKTVQVQSGQIATVAGAGQPPAPPAAMPAEEVKKWVAQEQWLVERVQQIEESLPVTPVSLPLLLPQAPPVLPPDVTPSPPPGGPQGGASPLDSGVVGSVSTGSAPAMGGAAVSSPPVSTPGAVTVPAGPAPAAGNAAPLTAPPVSLGLGRLLAEALQASAGQAGMSYSAPRNLLETAAGKAPAGTTVAAGTGAGSGSSGGSGGGGGSSGGGGGGHRPPASGGNNNQPPASGGDSGSQPPSGGEQPGDSGSQPPSGGTQPGDSGSQPPSGGTQPGGDSGTQPPAGGGGDSTQPPSGNNNQPPASGGDSGSQPPVTKVVVQISPLTPLHIAVGEDKSNLNLPSTVSCQLDDGSIVNLAVDWQSGLVNFSTQYSREYTLVGNLVNLPAGIVNTSNFLPTVLVYVEIPLGQTVTVTDPARPLIFANGLVLNLAGALPSGTNAQITVQEVTDSQLSALLPAGANLQPAGPALEVTLTGGDLNGPAQMTLPLPAGASLEQLGVFYYTGQSGQPGEWYYQPSSFSADNTGNKYITATVDHFSIFAVLAAEQSTAPVASPDEGTLPAGSEVTLSVNEGNIYYTTDGSEPVLGPTSDPVWNYVAITVPAGGITIKAFALQPNRLPSPVQTWQYTTIAVTPMLAAGGGHVLQLRDDGMVWAWGNNWLGQLGRSETYGFPQYNPPQPVNGLDNVVAVAAGAAHSLALKADGTVWAWGDNCIGQLGFAPAGPYEYTYPQPSQVPGLTEVKAITAGYWFSAALKQDGTVWTWGNNARGQLGTGNFESHSAPQQVFLPDDVRIKAIAAGDYHMLALDEQGRVWSWGDNRFGQLGHSAGSEMVATPCLVEGLDGVTIAAIAAGGGSDSDNIYGEPGGFSLALDSAGMVWAWGAGDRGQLGNGTTAGSSTPVLVSGLTGVRSLAAGYAHVLAGTVSGQVYGWGDNTFGQLFGLGGETVTAPALLDAGQSPLLAMAAGNSFSLLWRQGMTMPQGAGTNDSSQLGNQPPAPPLFSVAGSGNTVRVTFNTPVQEASLQQNYTGWERGVRVLLDNGQRYALLVSRLTGYTGNLGGGYITTQPTAVTLSTQDNHLVELTFSAGGPGEPFVQPGRLYHVNLISGCDIHPDNMETLRQSEQFVLDGLAAQLTWGSQPADLDLHLLVYDQNGQKVDHVYYGQEVASDGQAELGKFYNNSTGNDTNGRGPEVIYFKQLNPQYSYRLLVHNNSAALSGDSALGNSQAALQLFWPGEEQPVVYQIPVGQPGNVWAVVQVDDSGHQVTVVNQVYVAPVLSTAGQPAHVPGEKVQVTADYNMSPGPDFLPVRVRNEQRQEEIVLKLYPETGTSRYSALLTLDEVTDEDAGQIAAGEGDRISISAPDYDYGLGLAPSFQVVPLLQILDSSVVTAIYEDQNQIRVAQGSTLGQLQAALKVSDGYGQLELLDTQGQVISDPDTVLQDGMVLAVTSQGEPDRAVRREYSIVLIP